MFVTAFSAIILIDRNVGVSIMVTKRFLKNVIVVMVSVFMSLTVFQGVQAQQTGLDYQRQQRIVECVTLLVKS